jgi:cysteinyl-tRNA synthetase
VLGLVQSDPENFLKGQTRASATIEPKTGSLHFKGGVPTVTVGLSEQHIEELIAQRIEARKNKNWKESDRIRDELKAAGVILEDGPNGTTWRRA